MSKRKRYKASVHSWKSIFKKQKKEIRKNRVSSNANIGRASLTGYKVAKPIYLTAEQRQRQLDRLLGN